MDMVGSEVLDVVGVIFFFVAERVHIQLQCTLNSVVELGMIFFKSEFVAKYSILGFTGEFL